MLTLDHVILRTADADSALAMIVDRTGASVLAEPVRVNSIRSAIVRGGPIDIELLEIGAHAPPHTHGYGLGFVADRPLEAAISALRDLGFATSSPVRCTAGAGAQRRSWRAAQVHGLLPDPFPVATSTRPYGPRDRLAERLSTALVRVPGMAATATRDPGGSMVVITEYGFDAETWRADHPAGPTVSEVTVGAGAHLPKWSSFPLAGRGLLDVREGGPTGVTQLEFEDGRRIGIGSAGLRFASAPEASRVGFDGAGDVDP